MNHNFLKTEKTVFLGLFEKTQTTHSALLLYRYNSTAEDAAVEAFRAGCNIELRRGNPYYYSLASACLAGRITLHSLRDSLKPVLKARFIHGEFDPVGIGL